MQSPTNSISAFFYCTILVVCLSHQSDGRDTITTSNPLRDDAGESLISADGTFELGFFTPGGKNRYVGIWYHILPLRVVWVANRDNPVQDSSGSFAIAKDGNLKVLSNGNPCLISKLENAGAGVNRTVKLLNNGNLIIFDGPSPSEMLWQSFENPTDTFLPGMKMDDQMVLTSWSNSANPAKGNYKFRKDQELYKIQNGSNLYWRSGEPDISIIPNKMPPDLAYFLSGSTEGLDESKNLSHVALNKTTSLNYTWPFRLRYNVAGLFMNSTGEIQYYRWSDREEWTMLWSQPQDRCSVYNFCGKFSICDINNDIQCPCLPGFQRVSTEDLNYGDYSRGCEMRNPVRCDNTAVEMKQSQFLNLSLTNFGGSFQQFDEAQNKEECEKECQNNCKCNAYYIKANATHRGETDVSFICLIGTEDLEDLRVEHGEGGIHLSVRKAVPDMVTSLKARDCKPCGDIMIPYPLSTRPNCGDPLYSSFDCDNSTGIFNFQTLGRNYQVININKENRTFVIEVNSVTANSCDASTQIVKLNQSSPFTVTNQCYERRIEISWKPPLEPSCNVPGDCRDWTNSSCHAKANGVSRCYCDQEYQWNGTSLNCVQGRRGRSQDISGPAQPPYPSASAGRSLAKWLKDVIIIIAVFAAALLVCCFSYNLYRRKRMTKRGGSGENIRENPVLWPYESSDRQVSDLMDEENKSGVGVPFCSWESILAATENFSDVHKLGRGGFGPVYKGMFPGGQEIAVKRLSTYSLQGINEFRNEVILIAKLQHRNLVRLLGYCIKENEKILLYEYMPNKSLDAFIFDKKLCMLLNWKKRFDIILGIARGVLYLHQDSRLRIIHRDLKTSNILLDEEMNPKISDFGLARIVEGKGTEASTNKVVGTYGYMSPEYALDGLFSIKSDVFSFGVVVLEIISGKRNTGFYGSTEALNLLGYAWRLWSENRALDLMDPILLESCEKSEVMKCINVGLLCVQEDPGDRPTMSNVVFMLDGEAIALPVPNQPAFVTRKPVLSTSSSSTKPGSISNELTMSVAEGR
ncbi:G-type lectin S-receptor-like serine threonine-kinase At4g03230 [Olea europaea subsp. europaea]|uniref:non-specific serine/threonine protein kinase n=1 Tax=Olea europaea subsp. europaea TaxID=158383 RepID=A0A8S0UI24_OLEEU|nr:G-type lectin S-receptor-like serine threonine-kinase At4g03230 [Olea europaea subsp. europaea]